MNPTRSPRILIVRLSAIGDCVMASPIAQSLRAHFPDAYIAWVVRDKCRAVVENNPYIDEIIPWHGGFGGLWGALRIVRARKFDVVLETQGLLKSTLLMALSGARQKLVSPRFGRLARLLSTQIIEHPPGWIYPPDRYLYWAKALGAPLPDRTELTVPIQDADEKSAAEFLHAHEINDETLLIGINAGCSAQNRKWSLENFAQSAQLLNADFPDARFVLFGGPQDREDTARLMKLLPDVAVDAAGQLSLRASASLIEKCAVLLTNDTGPMHIAVAVETPVVAVCGPIAAAHRLPLHDPKTIHIGLEANENCRPPNRRKCDKNQNCACLAAIAPATVALAAHRSIERKAAPAGRN